MSAPTIPEVYTPREIAEAAGIAEHHVRGMLVGGEIRSLAALAPGQGDRSWHQLIPHGEAVRAVRALRSGTLLAPCDPSGVRRLLAPDPRPPQARAVPLALSTSVHALMAVLLLVLASLGLTSAAERMEVIEPDRQPSRLVYLAQPGPGGGGGGGGLKMRTPPPKARRAGDRKPSSPIPARRLLPPPAPRPVEPPPPPLEARTLPPVVAPVATVPADARNQEGVMKEAPPEAPPSQGPGAGGGAGTGQGTGLGEGTGSGIGPGEGGGIGGGPYRPGSGVDPPRLLREVRARYSDEARRANITGEVLLEIVVRRDGSVGDVRVLQRLGWGLDERAVQAVRQWRFAPARLKGTAVDVMVEVAVEFTLR
jgi:TonB family protein